VRTLNPAPYSPEEEEEPLHSCEEVLDKIFFSGPTYLALLFPLLTWSSSLMKARAYKKENTRLGMQ
jgi:hypothetical protein